MTTRPATILGIFLLIAAAGALPIGGLACALGYGGRTVLSVDEAASRGSGAGVGAAVMTSALGEFAWRIGWGCVAGGLLALIAGGVLLWRSAPAIASD